MHSNQVHCNLEITETTDWRTILQNYSVVSKIKNYLPCNLQQQSTVRLEFPRESMNQNWEKTYVTQIKVSIMENCKFTNKATFLNSREKGFQNRTVFSDEKGSDGHRCNWRDLPKDLIDIHGEKLRVTHRSGKHRYFGVGILMIWGVICHHVLLNWNSEEYKKILQNNFITLFRRYRRTMFSTTEMYSEFLVLSFLQNTLLLYYEKHVVQMVT